MAKEKVVPAYSGDLYINYHSMAEENYDYEV